MADLLAVLSPNQKYVKKLTGFMEKQGTIPFSIQGFDSRVRLHTFMQEHKLSVLLLDEKWKDEDFSGMTALTILLVEEKACEKVMYSQREFPSIFKFQSGEQICKKILDICAQMPSDKLFQTTGRKSGCQIVGIYSPIKRSLQTSFAFIYSRLKAANKKTLYLNFEVFSGFSVWFQKEYHRDLMDLMYYLKDDPERFLLKMAAMTEEFGNVKYIPPAYSYEDFMQISADQWIKFIHTIATESDYEVLVLDLDDQMQGLFSILSMCDSVYTMTKADGLAMAKVATYEEMLRLGGREDVLRKTIKCQLPIFRDLPQEVNELSYSSLADYLKNKLGEDF